MRSRHSGGIMCAMHTEPIREALAEALTGRQLLTHPFYRRWEAGTLAEQNMATMHIDWVTFEGKKMPYRPAEPGEHRRLIVEATWEKVRQNPEVKRVLLATGDLKLKPDHHQEPNAPAAWRYYDILMNVRAQLRRQANE